MTNSPTGWVPGSFSSFSGNDEASTATRKNRDLDYYQIIFKKKKNIVYTHKNNDTYNRFQNAKSLYIVFLVWPVETKNQTICFVISIITERRKYFDGI